MTYPVTIVDNFFEDPDGIVEMAESMKYYTPTTGNWPGTRTKNLHVEDKRFFNYFGQKLHLLFYETIYIGERVRDIIYGDGIEGRYNKYKRLNKIARDILDPKLISVIDPGESDYLMTLYKHPDPTFDFQEFKENMRHLNIILQDSVIFSNDLIRIGNIGEWTEQEFAKTLNLLVNKLKL